MIQDSVAVLSHWVQSNPGMNGAVSAKSLLFAVLHVSLHAVPESLPAFRSSHVSVCRGLYWEETTDLFCKLSSFVGSNTLISPGCICFWIVNLTGKQCKSQQKFHQHGWTHWALIDIAPYPEFWASAFSICFCGTRKSSFEVFWSHWVDASIEVNGEALAYTIVCMLGMLCV